MANDLGKVFFFHAKRLEFFIIIAKVDGANKKYIPSMDI